MKDQREWFKVHTGFFRHPKIMQLTPAETVGLMKLWAHSVEQKTDGILNKFEIKAHITSTQLQKFIALNLVEKTTDKNVYKLHDFEQHQLTRAEYQERLNRKSEGASLAMHNRWHKARNQPSADCIHCQNTYK